MWLHHSAGESHMKTDWGEVLDGEIMRAPVNLADGMLRLHDTPSSVNAHKARYIEGLVNHAVCMLVQVTVQTLVKASWRCKLRVYVLLTFLRWTLANTNFIAVFHQFSIIFVFSGAA